MTTREKKLSIRMSVFLGLVVGTLFDSWWLVLFVLVVFLAYTWWEWLR